MRAINFQSLLRRHPAYHNDLQLGTQLSMSFVKKRKPIRLPNHRPASVPTCAALPSNHLQEPAGKSWSLAALTDSYLPQFWRIAQKVAIIILVLGSAHQNLFHKNTLPTAFYSVAKTPLQIYFHQNYPNRR